MNLDEIIRNRNNKMCPEDVISFYRQALYNNRYWLAQAIRENDTKEIERISVFIERGERELSYAETRLILNEEPDDYPDEFYPIRHLV
jgi:hypothetical protein